MQQNWYTAGALPRARRGSAPGSAPDPAGELTALPSPIAGFKGGRFAVGRVIGMGIKGQGMRREAMGRDGGEGKLEQHRRFANAGPTFSK